MKGWREYEIPFVGLRVGVHRFSYEVDKRFFDHFAESPIHDCAVKVTLDLEKKETFFVLRFSIDGNVHVECDRCLAPFDKSIFGDYTMYVKFADEPEKMEADDEVMYLPREASHIDISQLVYEYINLCLPMQLSGCKSPGQEPQCDKEVLKKISSSNEPTADTDPRWAALKELKN